MTQTEPSSSPRNQVPSDNQTATWLAENVRVTLFLREPADAAGLWEKLTGEPPDTDEARPREGIRIQNGKFGDGILLIQAMPLRLDILMVPQSPESGTLPTMHFGDVQSAVKQFWTVVEPWLNIQSAKPSRVAFGLSARMPVPDRTTAYRELQRLVPSVQFDSEHTREALYQINRPKQSRALPGIELNRITKWNSVKQGQIFASIGPGVPPTVVTSDSEHFVHCECDNSTPQDGTTELDAKVLPSLFEELRDMALENLAKGEIP